MLGCGFWWSGLTAFFSFNMSFLLRKVEDVTTISKSQSLTSVSIKDCTLRVPDETTTLFLLRVIIKAIFIHHCCYYLANLFGNMTCRHFTTCTFSNVHMTMYWSSRSDDSSGPLEVCHAWRTDLPGVLARRCYSSSAQVQCKRQTNSPCHLTLHRPTSNTRRRAPWRMQGQNSYFHESHWNSNSIVLFVKSVVCLIFHCWMTLWDKGGFYFAK